MRLFFFLLAAATVTVALLSQTNQTAEAEQDAEMAQRDALW